MPHRKLSRQHLPSNPSSPLVRQLSSRVNLGASSSPEADCPQQCREALSPVQVLKRLESLMKRRFSASSGGLSATKCNGLSDSELISTVQMLREVLDDGVQAVQDSLFDADFLRRTLMVVADCSACLALKRWMLQCGILPKVLFMVNHPGPVRFQLLAMQTLTDLTAEDNFRELLMAEDQQWPVLNALVELGIDVLRDVQRLPAIREYAARMIKNLSTDDQLSDSIAARNGVQVLVDSCHFSGTSLMQEQAARALGNMAMNDVIEERIVRAGGVEALTNLLHSESNALLDATLSALANLISNADVRQRMVTSRGVQLLEKALRSESELLYKQAGWLVACLAVDPQVSGVLIEEGGLICLVHYAAKDNEGYQEEAAWALANLSSLALHALPMAQAGVLQRLLKLASSRNGNVRMQAVWAIANLAVDEEVKELLGGLNAVPILFSVLANKDTVNEVQTLVQTTRAIANLAVTANNRQLMRIHPTGLLQLIDLAQSPFNSVLEAAARALVNLSYDADVARAIVRAGGIRPITEMLKSPKTQVQQEATWVVVNLSVLPENEGVLAVPAVLEPLIRLLQIGDPSVQEQAVWALGNVSANATSKVAIIHLGALGALRALNEHRSSPELQVASSKALHSLCQVLTPLSRRVYGVCEHASSHTSANKKSSSPLAQS
eukprot:CAMPEP_0181185316 /NCGR_PEP_ID=MMETSP1096-20121128/9441_1 /TAXON_ID=156174 ORGANISM="Chrysochromulina ericina, Strain CCMP281" /NCGR_SAMPLE_ID=MMETSP1096 /ASSEMBLY_ACC=CAM_ASM_000453 /LENGTH=667 /DNA_ID=CAMNT_0023274149 /DNA_START=379 /DNA_END=2385 /DNA_ORIENTATION=-